MRRSACSSASRCSGSCVSTETSLVVTVNVVVDAPGVLAFEPVEESHLLLLRTPTW